MTAVAVLGTTAAILRKKVDVFKNFDLAGAKLADKASLTEKAKFYGTKVVSYVGEKVNQGVDYVVRLFKGLGKGSEKPQRQLQKKQRKKLQKQQQLLQHKLQRQLLKSRRSNCTAAAK